MVLGRSAERDLVEAAAWYIEAHPSGEERFFDAFSTARDILARHPRAGRERSEFRVGLRSCLVHPYVVFYAVNDKTRVITIERVIHGHMDTNDDNFND